MVQYMKDPGNKAARMAREDMYLEMAISMLVNTMMEKGQVEVACIMLQNKRSMTVSGATIDDREKALSWTLQG